MDDALISGPVGADRELPGHRLAAYDTLASTNDEAKRLARAGAEAGLAVWARRQTQGRGRLDREWQSPEGNLYVSFLLRPDVPVARAAELGFVASLAAAETVADHVGEAAAVQVKWPNDVLLAGAKVAGILLECETQPGQGVDWVVVGIGINVASAPVGTPYPAGSIAAVMGSAPEVFRVLTTLAGLMSRHTADWRQHGFSAVRSRWLERAARLGATIDVRRGLESLSGIFRDLDPDGVLVLETPSGIRRITAGDIYFPNAATRQGMGD